MNLSSRSLQTLDDARALALFGLKLQSLLLSLNGDREAESWKEERKKKYSFYYQSVFFLSSDLLPRDLLVSSN